MSLRLPWCLALLLWLGCSSSDRTSSCTALQVACGGACVDVTTDARHCGACGNACGAEHVCVAARCQPVCPNGQNLCGTACVDLQNDQSHCGDCGTRCPPGRVCIEGACEVECGPGGSPCEGASEDGGKTLSCVNLELDRSNCGGCGNACPTGHLCRGGVCVVSCPAGQTACGDHCVDLTNDNLNCGACRAACATSFACQMGRCRFGACPADTTLCSGRCVDVEGDRQNCGACSAACPSANVCTRRTCMPGCSAGETLCMENCADLATDPRNCGRCGAACMPGTVCQGGECVTVCQMGQMLCEGRCVDLTSDRAHCGRCSNLCPGSQVCTGGACAAVCGAGQTLCGTTCTDTMTDRESCGACDRACPAGNACVGGRCVPFAPVPADGGCSAPSVMCGVTCTDVRSDNHHCGRCGEACSADRACFNGMCLPTCALGESRCPTGACVNLSNSAANCGACGMACPAGQFCFRGRCNATAPPTRYTASAAPPEVTFIDACMAAGASRVLDAMNDGNVAAPIPFAFRYWNVDLPEGFPANITTNGYLNLDRTPASSASIFIPSSSTPNGVISLHAGDLFTSGPICVATLGSAPNRRWVVEWSNAAERTGIPIMSVGTLVFEVIVSEGTDLIDFVFQRMDGAISHYTGLESPALSPTGVAGCPSGTSFTYFCTPMAGARIRFTPAP